MSDKYTPKNAENLMSLGLLAQVKAICKELGDSDLTSFDLSTRLATAEGLGFLIHNMIEAELLRPESDGELPMLLSVQGVIKKLGTLVEVLESRSKFGPLIKAIQNHELVTKLHVRSPGGILAKIMGVEFGLCAHLGDDNIPFLWVKEKECFQVALMLRKNGDKHGILEHPISKAFITELTAQFPDLIIIEDLTNPDTDNPIASILKQFNSGGHADGNDEDGNPFMN